MITVTLDKFEEIFKQLLDKKEKTIVLFTSDADADGVYWCPDCEKVAPLYPTLEEEAKKTGLNFYKFIAGDRPTWKNPDHVFRKHAAIKAKSVPTFGFFNGKKVVSTLTEGDILD